MAAGETTSAALTEEALLRAQDPAGEGSKVFSLLLPEAARAQAAASDLLRGQGIVPSLLAGIPISIKALLDIRGCPTTVASPMLRDAPPAREDSMVVARLRAAGAIIVGHTNMVEFASSSLGLNPHYGTPRNRWDRAVGRIPGGSSSGAAISVTDGMSTVAIGSDTGGSIRIPAALNGITGFKPTQRRVPLEGCHLLSQSFDSLGPLGWSVTCCALIDAVLSGLPVVVPKAMPLNRLAFAVPRGGFFLDDLDRVVGPCFESALQRLSANGARIVEVDLPELSELQCISQVTGVPGASGKSPLGIIVSAENYALHRHLVERHRGKIDPRVEAMIQYGANVSAADYIDMLQARRIVITAIEDAIGGFAGLLTPTIPCIAPELALLETSEEAYSAANIRISRNTSAINVLDGCALTIPCQEIGTAPVGLSIVGLPGRDQSILASGLSVEATLARGA